jgi:hypothetical protein
MGWLWLGSGFALISELAQLLMHCVPASVNLNVYKVLRLTFGSEHLKMQTQWLNS